MEKYELTKNDLLSMIALTLYAVLKDSSPESIVELAEVLYDDVTSFYVHKN